MVINWRIKGRDGAAYVIEFWTKKDRSNAITARLVTVDEEKVRRTIVNSCGHTNFEMVFHKEKR